MWREGAIRRRAPVRRPALVLLCYQREAARVSGQRGGRRAAPLPHLRLSQVAPVRASPLSQRAHDGVGDVSQRRGMGGLGNGGLRAGLPGSRRARHWPLSRLPQALSGPLPRFLLQDGLHVVPEATLGAVVAAGGEFGDLERRVGLPLTAPLNGLQLAANAVHGVVTTGRLGRAEVHAAGCRAAVPASWADTAKSAKISGFYDTFNNSLLYGRQEETSKT